MQKLELDLLGRYSGKSKGVDLKNSKIIYLIPKVNGHTIEIKMVSFINFNLYTIP